MVTGSIIAAIIAAAVGIGTAVSKGVQSSKHKKKRKEEGEKVTDAMAEAGQAYGGYRQEQRQEGLQGLSHQMGQMEPFYGAMEQAYGGAGYERPDMSWLEQELGKGPQTFGNEPRPNAGGGGRSPPPGARVTGPLSVYGAPAGSPLGQAMQEGNDYWGHSAGGLK